MKTFIILLSIVIFSTFSIAYAERGGRTGFGRGGSHGTRPHQPGGFHSHGNGHIERPVRFYLPHAPYGGWRGSPYYWSGQRYFVWGFIPGAPFYAWQYYYGWTPTLYYYVPEGLRCFADNSSMPGLWQGQEVYYSSNDAVESALGYCESDQNVISANAQVNCRIRNCTRW
jgi:hypothetical protein